MEKIMIVDDVEISNFILKKTIEKVSPQSEVVDFTKPEIAIEEIATLKPDLLFLDLNMPVIDGWGFLDLMNEKGIDIPVYILTSSTSEVDKMRTSGYSMVRGFLSKPLNEKMLRSIFVEMQAAA